MLHVLSMGHRSWVAVGYPLERLQVGDKDRQRLFCGLLELYEL